VRVLADSHAIVWHMKNSERLSATASNGVAPIRGKARREAIEAFLEMTSKDQGLSPELKARLKDDAWGKRLVDP